MTSKKPFQFVRPKPTTWEQVRGLVEGVAFVAFLLVVFSLLLVLFGG